MRVKKLLVLSLVLVAFAACRGGERSTLTGAYAGGVLAGSVVLNGIEGTPDGVEVSVRDTGMSMTLGADGEFLFSGVPQNAVLDFRRSDGIEASLAVSGQHSGVIVALGRSSASAGSKRGNRNKDKREFEGVIKSATGAEIVLLTSHREEVVIRLAEETVIRRGNETLQPADLEAGMRVHVRARKSPSSGELTAQLVIVQGGHDDDDDDDDPKPAVREYEGTIVRASATELVVYTSKKREETFVINGDTTIRKGNTPVAPEDLRPGQRVHVKATEGEGGVRTAVLVILQNTRTTVSVSGTVLGVAGGNITVQTRNGEWTVQTSASTRIRRKGRTIGLSDISAGDSISAKGEQVSANTILASEVDVRGRSGRP